MPRCEVVEVLGHTLQVVEKDDRLIIHEILPAPFLPQYDLPDVAEHNRAMEAAWRDRQRAERQAVQS